MTWQEKATALNALSELTLQLTSTGLWYVRLAGVEIKDGSVLRGGGLGSHQTPAGAVEQAWTVYVDTLPEEQYLVKNAYGTNRNAVRWNGFMWAAVQEPQEVAA